MHNSIDKNRGTHGDSSFMLDRLLSSRENPMPKGMGSVNVKNCKQFKTACLSGNHKPEPGG